MVAQFQPKAGSGPATVTPAMVSLADTGPVRRADAEDNAGPGLVEYWRVLLHYKWSILGIVIIAAIVGLMSAISAQPVYRAEARLLVQFNPVANIRGVQMVEPTLTQAWILQQTLSDILRSRAIAEKVVRRLGLHESDPVVPKDEPAIAPPAEHPLKAQLKQIRDSVKLPQWRQWMPAEWRSPPPPPRLPEHWLNSQIERIRTGLVIGGGRESSVFSVGFMSSDPQQAADIANAVAEAYIEFTIDDKEETSFRQVRWLQQRVEELRADMDERARAVTEYQSQVGMGSVEQQDEINRNRIGQLISELTKAVAVRSQLEARVRQLRNAMARGVSSDTVVTLFGNDNLVLELERRISNVQRTVSELSERYGHKHPKMIAARNELRELRNALKSKVANGVANAQQELDVAIAHVKELDNLKAVAEKEVRGKTGDAYQLSQLEREAKAARELYLSVLEQYKVLALSARDTAHSNVRLIDRAIRPAQPSAPDRQRIVIVAALTGLVIAVALALLRNYLDATFKTREDVEHHIGLPVFGVVPQVNNRKAPRISLTAADEPQGQFTEAINDVRTAILLSQVDEPPKVIMLTSTTAGEGKTTLACNLAIAFSQRGRTLLLEADLRRGDLSKALGINTGPGLSDFVSGACSLQDALLQLPELPTLYVMQGGTTPPNAIEIISSHKFNLGLHNLREAFDFIIIDTSPVLPVSDAVVLGNSADAILLVIQTERTSQASVKLALKRLQAARLRPVGVVLQQANMKRVEGYGQYYGGYHQYYTKRRT